jgi:TldD protein
VLACLAEAVIRWATGEGGFSGIGFGAATPDYDDDYDYDQDHDRGRPITGDDERGQSRETMNEHAHEHVARKGSLKQPGEDAPASPKLDRSVSDQNDGSPSASIGEPTVRHLAHKLMDVARGRGIGFADVRLRRSAGTAVFVQDGRVEQASSGTSATAGIRALVDGAWGFACVESLDLRALTDALEAAEHAAREVARGGERKAAVSRPGVIDRESDEAITFSPRAASLEDKAARLVRLEEMGRDAVRPGAIVNSAVSYADGEATEVVANTFGTVVSQHHARATCACSMIAREGNATESWTEKIGVPGGTDLLANIEPEQLSVKAAREALEQTRAAPAPGGEMPVIFDPSITGLFIHECLGHSVEADMVLRGHSILAGRIGQKIASPLVTIVDDPTLSLAWGGYRYDSEGVPAERVTLIEGGVLVGWLESLETASRTGRSPNGHGRAEGALARPIPRMSNTFLVPGEHDVDEMIRGIERGVLVAHGESGYTMAERGQYSCSANRGWRIEHGAVGEPVRHVSVSGDILETLRAIDRVSTDFLLCDPGYCTKDGQDVPVDNGGPYVRVNGVLVGGVMDGRIAAPDA